jgi:hypothetical protein
VCVCFMGGVSQRVVVCCTCSAAAAAVMTFLWSILQ